MLESNAEIMKEVRIKKRLQKEKEEQRVEERVRELTKELGMEVRKEETEKNGIYYESRNETREIRVGGKNAEGERRILMIDLIANQVIYQGEYTESNDMYINILKMYAKKRINSKGKGYGARL